MSEQKTSWTIRHINIHTHFNQRSVSAVLEDEIPYNPIDVQALRERLAEIGMISRMKSQRQVLSEMTRNATEVCEYRYGDGRNVFMTAQQAQVEGVIRV